ncbi:MAG: single-stranded-DNA-specific exonuclease RecJ [bacterium]|nr:single-stranded-DNA-specific exonuclease RecJ [bacterium]
MKEKVWGIRGSAREIDDFETLVLRLLENRNVLPKEQETFFAPSYERDIHDPYSIAHMEKAVERIMRAIKHKERIVVYGDYDADGITSTAIMIETLIALGAHVIPYLPHRYDDGYGLNGVVLQQMLPEFEVLVTVDCGISNGAEIAMLNASGKDVIIVDHHEFPETMPEAYAILHPRHADGSYKWGHLCGAGMSWKFAQALFRHRSSPFADDADREKWLLDIVMIGTIADVMPLLGENRAIVRFGKEVLMRTKHPGIAALLKESRIHASTITAEDIAFRIVPLLNAAGRIGHPQSALDALMAQTPEQAEITVKKLVQLNNERRTLTKKMMDEANMEIDHSLPFVFIHNTQWSAGIVGLVAGRLASQFSKPAFVVGGHSSLAHAVGSARGGGNGNVLSALETVRHHTLKLGGHKAAAGFSARTENLEHMKEGLHEYFLARQSAAGHEGPEVIHTADAIISSHMVTWDTARQLAKFEPFGEANVKPTFVLQGLPLLSIRTVGKSNDHIKAKLLVGEREVDAIGFGLGQQLSDLRDSVDVIASIGVNEFRGKESLELRLADIAPANAVTINRL